MIASGHRALVLQVLTLLFLTSFATAANAQPQDQPVPCLEDCDEYPDGFHRLQIGMHRFFIPLREFTLSDWSERRASVGEIVKFRSAVYAERVDSSNSEPRIIRTSIKDVRLQFTQCCDEFFAWFGLPENWGTSATVYLDPVTVRSSFDTYDTHSLYYLLTGTLLTDGAEINPQDLPAHKKKPFSDAFDLFDMREGGFQLISRGPLFRGHYIHVDCTNYCQFRTLTNPELAGTQSFHLTLESYFFGPDEVGSFENWRNFLIGGGISEQGASYFDASAELITTFEQMLLQASVLPLAVSGH